MRHEELSIGSAFEKEAEPSAACASVIQARERSPLYAC